MIKKIWVYMGVVVSLLAGGTGIVYKLAEADETGYLAHDFEVCFVAEADTEENLFVGQILGRKERVDGKSNAWGRGEIGAEEVAPGTFEKHVNPNGSVFRVRTTKGISEAISNTPNSCFEKNYKVQDIDADPIVIVEIK